MNRVPYGRRLAVLSACSLALWSLASCFSERAAGPGAGGECQVPVTVVNSRHVLVAIRNFAFAPDSIRVPAGATVTWLNCEDPATQAHTTTSTTGLWDSGSLVSSQRFSQPFGAAGVFPYICSFHPSMVGRVVVQ